MTNRLSIGQLPLVAPQNLDLDSDRILVYSPEASGRKSRALLLNNLPLVIESSIGVVTQRDDQPPTTRPDGSPLEVDDRWINSNDHLAFYWDNFWFSEQIFSCQALGATLLSLYPDYNICLEKWVITGRLSSNNATNHWNLRLATRTATASSVLSQELTNTRAANATFRAIKDLQRVIISNPNILGLAIMQSTVGSPGNLNEQHYQVFYRLIPRT